MSVDLVTRRIRSDGGDSSPAGSQSLQKRKREYYDVSVTDTGDTTDTVLDSPLVPQPRSQHPDGLYLRASERSATKLSPSLYELVVDYEAPSLSIPTQTPMGVPPKIKFMAEDNDEAIDIDQDGNPIRTALGEQFADNLTENIPLTVIWIQRNVTWVDPFVMEEYRNATNSDNWYGFAPGCCCIRRLEAESVDTEDFVYWTVTALIAVKRGARYNTTDAKAWYRRVLARGFRVRYKLFGIVKDGPATNPDGTRVTSPVYHRVYGPDGVTPALPSGDPGNLLGEKISDPTQAQWYEWRTKPSKPYGFLGLL